MSVPTHTPGPWFVANNRDIHDKDTRFDENGARLGNTPNLICRIEYPYGRAEGQHANARLIAAAPQLLDALRACITEDGATCLKTSMNAATLLRRRIAAINELARAVIDVAQG